MTGNDDFEIRKELAVFGESSGRIFMNLIINKMEWYVTIYAFYPADRRFKAPLIRLHPDDLEALSDFLKEMLIKNEELKQSIPENKLFEDDILIREILIHYMVRRNKTDIIFYFPYRAGIAVRLTEGESQSMLKSLSDISIRVETIRKSFI